MYYLLEGDYGEEDDPRIRHISDSDFPPAAPLADGTHVRFFTVSERAMPFYLSVLTGP